MAESLWLPFILILLVVILYQQWTKLLVSANVWSRIYSAHINHIRNIAGEDHIGLGSGYDGINHTTRGLEDVSHYPDLLTTLLRDHDWNETQIKKIVGLNVLRVLQQVEKVRDELQSEFQPDEDSILAHYHYKSLPSSCAVHDL